MSSCVSYGITVCSIICTAPFAHILHIVQMSVAATHQSISIHSFAFVQPEVNQLLPTSEVLRVGLQKALEHVREVSHVELVVEVCRRFSEIVANLVR